MEKSDSISKYFEFNDDAFQFDSNFQDLIPSKKQPKLEKKMHDKFFVKTDSDIKKTEPKQHFSEPKFKTANSLVVTTSLHEASQQQEVQKPQGLNEIMQEISQGWHEMVMNCAQTLNASEAYENECLKCITDLTEHSEALLQKLLSQRDMINIRLQKIAETFKMKSH